MIRFQGKFYRLQEVNFIFLNPPFVGVDERAIVEQKDCIPVRVSSLGALPLVIQDTANLFGRDKIRLLDAIRNFSGDFDEIQVP